MNTHIFRILLGASVAVLICAAISAGEPEPARTVGKVLLLENERILEGDVERIGDRYRVRRNLGESWIPVEKALRLCTDLEDAYRYLRSHANLRDPDEHIRLARWCHMYRLWEHGREEAAAIVELRPDNAEGQRLVRLFQRYRENQDAPPVPQRAPTSETPSEAPGGIELTQDALAMFYTRVQPILMNACSRCHSGDKGGSFHLVHVIGDGSVNGRTTQQNRAAALAFVHAESWQTSPLLLKSISAHGGTGEPPLKGRHAPAFHTLEDWVQLAATSLPAVKPVMPAVAAARPVAPTARSAPVSEAPESSPVFISERGTGTKEMWAIDRKDTSASPVAEPEKMPASTPTPVKPEISAENTQAPAVSPAEPPTAKPPAPPQEPVDPFDPVIFNQQGQSDDR